jgi:SSS family solute:Na+ symporter
MHDVGSPTIALHGSAVWAFIGYLALVFAIGVWATRRSSQGVDAFFLAGRSLNRWVVALSAVVSGRSSWLLLAVSGLAYRDGVSAAWASVGYIVVEFVLFWDYAGRLRRFSEARDCITLPDFLAARFADKRGVLRLLLVVVILAFLPTYVGAQFKAGGKAFAAGFGMDETSGVLTTAGIVLVYTAMGGFLAVAITDMLQAVFMIVALVVLPVAAIWHMGGVGPLWDGLAAIDPTLVDPFAIAPLALLGYLAIGLGSPGNPHILVRYMSIDDPEQLRASAVVGTVWNVIMAAGAVATGLAARLYFGDGFLAPGADTEQVYPTLAAAHLPPVVFGVVVASVFAAIMSTTDSQLLVAASAVVRDLYQKILKRDQEVDPKRLVVMSRVVVFVLVVISTGLGLMESELVFWFVLLAWAGLGAALGPTSLLALYWRRTTLAGVAAGMLVGGVTTFVWRMWLKESTGLYELVPAFVLGLLATVLVSLVTRPPADTDDSFEVMTSPGASPASRS